MNVNIKEIEEIILTDKQLRMIESGWGAEALTGSKVSAMLYQSGPHLVKAYLAEPLRYESARYPVILWNRGGIGRRGAIDEFQARGMFGLMASWGYCVLATQYRGSGDDNGIDEFGGSDLDDVTNLTEVTSQIAIADTSRMGIEGWSRGGMMTFLTLRKLRNFKCAVIISGISDVSDTYRNSNTVRELIQDQFPGAEPEKEMRNRSAIHFADQLPSETVYLLIHGGADEVVSPLQTIRLAERFTGLGFKYRMHIFEGGDHLLKDYRRETDAARKEWYGKFLL